MVFRVCAAALFSLCAAASAGAADLRGASPHAAGAGRPPVSWRADPGSGVGPLRVAPAMDCAVRSLALNYSSALLPWADASLVADALRLEADCGAAPPARGGGSPAAPNPVPAPAPGVSAVFFADPVRGDDGAAGTQAAPFRTLARGLAATRAVTPGAPAQLVLRAGTFALAAAGGALALTAADSGLTISAFPGEAPVLSGGVPLAGLTWTRAPAPSPPPPPPPMTPPVQGSLLCAPPLGCCVDGAGKSNPGVCAALAQTASAAACAALCLGNATCTGYTWHTAAAGSFANWCYARLDGIDICDGAAEHTSGWKPAPGPPAAVNVWAAALPPQTAAFDQLFMNGRRLVRARHPNANPETDLSPAGYMNPVAWAPAATYPAPEETHVNNVRPYDPWFPNFQWGVNGTVANFTSGSFWGTRAPPAGDQYHVPCGVTLPGDIPAAGAWANPSEAVVHAFQGGHWGDWAFAVASQNGPALTFAAGGWQEARGGSGQALFVEGVRELLDAVGEWHLNTSAPAPTLTVAFNGSAHDGSETLVAAQLAELVTVVGSRAAPARNITLAGLTFAHTLADFFFSFNVPSGGDWSYHAGGALRLAGTEGVRVLSCVFDAPGGNAIMLAGHNRAAVIAGNSFAWTGASAIVSAGTGGGLPDGGDDFPEGTLIEGNLMREIAVIVKQSGGLYMAVSANLTLRGNVIFNAARAGVNINDGFAGGHLITQNLIFNTGQGVDARNRPPLTWTAPGVTRLPLPSSRRARSSRNE